MFSFFQRRHGERESGSSDYIADVIADVVARLDVELTEQNVARLGEAASRAFLGSSSEFLNRLERSARRGLKREAKFFSGFKKRLRRTWNPGLDRLDILISLCHEGGETVYVRERETAALEKDVIFFSLVPLHARSCQVAREIAYLMAGGFAAGAHARWRSLHEIAVVAQFLRANGVETAQRYLDHGVVDSYRSMRQYLKFQARLALDEVTRDEVAAVTERFESLKAAYGTPFVTDYGWAAAILRNDRPSFADIEDAVDLGHWRPYYRLASTPIHAGAKGLFFNLGLSPGVNAMPTGSSNAGLADPGQGCAISLLQVTTALLTHRPKSQDVMLVHALEELVVKIQDDLIRSHQHVENLTAKKLAGQHASARSGA